MILIPFQYTIRFQACAHRFRKTGPGFDYGPGLCIVMSNELDEDNFLEPCEGKPKADGHGQYGLCQAGTSLDLSEVGAKYVPCEILESS